MTLRVLLIATSLGLTGCAGGDDPAESGTDIGSAGTTGNPENTTGDVTMSSSSSSSSSTNPTSAESSSTDAESSSSTGAGVTTDPSSSSTGTCELSTEGCACDPAADPECGDGLVCNAENLCEAALCTEEKSDEPNGDPFEPFPLMDLEDNDDPVLHEAQLSGDGDVDWYRYGCNDPLLGLSEPNLDVTVPEGTRACFFLDCVQGGNPLFECPAGTEEENAPIDNLPGCCATGSFAAEVATFNCPDSSEDALEVYVRIEDGPADACSDYSFLYGC